MASPMAQTPVAPQAVGKPVSPVTAVKGGKRVTVVAPGDSGPLVIDTDVVLPHGDAGGWVGVVGAALQESAW